MQQREYIFFLFLLSAFQNHSVQYTSIKTTRKKNHFNHLTSFRNWQQILLRINHRQLWTSTLKNRIKKNLHFEENVTGQHVHLDGDPEHGVVLPVTRVVALQQTAPSAETSSGEFGEVQVAEAELLEGPASLRFLPTTVTRSIHKLQERD